LKKELPVPPELIEEKEPSAVEFISNDQLNANLHQDYFPSNFFKVSSIKIIEIPKKEKK
jgi:hypothetical protein